MTPSAGDEIQGQGFDDAIAKMGIACNEPRRYKRICLTSIHLGDADALSGREDQTIRLWKHVTQRGARGTFLTIFDKQPHPANRGRVSQRLRKTRPDAKRAVNSL